jgi:hypothetical protein
MTAHAPRTVVVGAGIAGALAVGALAARADAPEEILWLEQDRLPRSHPRPAQLVSGEARMAMEAIYPGITGMLLLRGAISGDLRRTHRWQGVEPHDLSPAAGAKPEHGLLVSLSLVETVLRMRALECHGVRLLEDCRAECIVGESNAQALRGLMIRQRGRRRLLLARRVVHCAGSAAIAGAQAPEELLSLALHCHTQCFRREAGQLHGAGGLLVRPALATDASAVLTAVEGGRWQATLAAPGAGFDALWAEPDLAALWHGAEKIGSLHESFVPLAWSRHWSQWRGRPAGLLALGSSFRKLHPLFHSSVALCALQAKEMKAAGDDADYLQRAERIGAAEWGVLLRKRAVSA